jgi:hypothetical protein
MVPGEARKEHKERKLQICDYYATRSQEPLLIPAKEDEEKKMEKAFRLFVDTCDGPLQQLRVFKAGFYI